MRRSAFGDAVTIAAAVARGMRITLLNLFRKPVTVHYPTVARPVTDRFRGLLALTYDKDTGEENCIGCRLCEFICPPAVIKVEMLKAEKRNYAKTFTLELYACEFCELCVQVCPTDAIVMMKSFDLSTADRREMLLDKDRLHVLGLQHVPSWATGNRLRDMQQPPKREAGNRKRGSGVMLEIAAFWTCAAALVGSALGVVLGKNLFHSVLWLALALISTAAIFLTLDAEFLAAVQILLYAGGVVTVVVFAIVVTERLVGERLSHVSRRVATSAVVCAALLAVLVRAIEVADVHLPRPALTGDLTAQLGTSLLTRYVLPFQLLAVLLVVGLLAASYFARPED
jgi:NADH-quinone oxidoreductase subunit J